MDSNYSNILIAMNPIIPHFSNECLENLGIINDKIRIHWPKINEKILIKDHVNFIIQINGKTRAILKLKKSLKEKEVLKEIQKNDKIKNYLENKKTKKIIFIENKLINIII